MVDDTVSDQVAATSVQNSTVENVRPLDYLQSEFLKADSINGIQ